MPLHPGKPGITPGGPMGPAEGKGYELVDLWASIITGMAHLLFLGSFEDRFFRMP